MTLGQNLARLRAEKNLSQGDLADALEVSRQSVSKWETDASIPELDKLVRLAALFDVTLDELVKGEAPRSEEETGRAEGAAATPLPTAAPRRETRQIVGVILLCFGTLIGVLIALFGGTLGGFILALPLFVCGAVCLTVKRRAGLWCAWALYLSAELYLRLGTGLSWVAIFQTFRWTAEMNYVRLAIAWGQAACLLVMLFCTLLSYRALTLPCGRKQLSPLGAGWLLLATSRAAQSAWLRWIGENYTYELELTYFVAHHVVDLVRFGLFVPLLVLTAALWRGRRQSREKAE